MIVHHLYDTTGRRLLYFQIPDGYSCDTLILVRAHGQEITLPLAWQDHNGRRVAVVTDAEGWRVVGWAPPEWRDAYKRLEVWYV
jgi:hypothetical protein